MNIYVKGKLDECYEKPQYINKETGEASEKKFALQLITKVPLSNGAIKKEFVDITIKEDEVEKYKASIGKDIEVCCKLFSNSPISLSAM